MGGRVSHLREREREVNCFVVFIFSSSSVPTVSLATDLLSLSFSFSLSSLSFFSFCLSLSLSLCDLKLNRMSFVLRYRVVWSLPGLLGLFLLTHTQLKITVTMAIIISVKFILERELKRLLRNLSKRIINFNKLFSHCNKGSTSSSSQAFRRLTL